MAEFGPVQPDISCHIQKHVQISEIPDWVDKEPIAAGLPDFPGAQIQVVLPQIVPPNENRPGGRGDA